MTDERRDDPVRTPAELSAAARAIVRDPGDPRIDAHLAALGLGEDSPPPAGARAPGHSGAAELADLRRQVGELERELESGRARIRTLLVALGAAVVAVLVLLVVLLLR